MWRIILALYLLTVGIRGISELRIPSWVDGVLAILAALFIIGEWYKSRNRAA